MERQEKEMETQPIETVKPRGLEAKIQKMILKENVREERIKERKIIQKKIKKVGINNFEIETLMDDYRQTFDTNKPISIENNMFDSCDDETVFLLFKQFRKKLSENGTLVWSLTYTHHYAPLYKKTTGEKAPPLSNNIPIPFKKGLLDNFGKRQLVQNIPTQNILYYFDIHINPDEELPVLK
jgi:hypothetical protein